MANVFGTSSRGTRSFYQDLRARESARDEEEGAGLNVDDENLRQHFTDFDAEGLAAGDSRITVDSAYADTKSRGAPRSRGRQEEASKWPLHDDDADNDVPASLLVEHNDTERRQPGLSQGKPRKHRQQTLTNAPPPSARSRAQWEAATTQQRLHQEDPHGRPSTSRPWSFATAMIPGGPREKTLWRWVNTSNLDSFMRDVYDYYEGGGLRCILWSNALWLLETLFVAVLLTFLSQCVDYSKVPHSKSLEQIIVPQCTLKMSYLWNIGIFIYTSFFIWKSVQYFIEIRRLTRIREFFIYLLEIPEQDMQTVSWQDVVARIMTLRDQNPKTATNISPDLRRYLATQSKERLDAHDIANRLMRKENYLIAMINKDVLNLSLPLPLLRGRQLFSKTMEWYLHYCILDLAFNNEGQLQMDFLRPNRRRVLSQKLQQRFWFAGLLTLIFAPFVLGYVVIVYFFTYYTEYQRDPKLAAARDYTALAEWKFREFNELPHIFYERVHMSYPFATRYIDQFPKRVTEAVARTISFMAGAVTAVLAVGTVLDSELFLSFEITKDRTVLFYLGVFGAIWAVSRGMISEEANVFNPEYALRNVIEYTHYMPAHWEGRLHSAEVKQEFAELYKMKVVNFLEEVMGIITTPMLLFFSLPKSSDQIVDFFREFTIHVDGLGYVCSFAVFDFKKGVGQAGQRDPGGRQDVRGDYYSTKHGKMAASYYGFIDNYVINPKTGIFGHTPPGLRQQFHPPPAFPGLNSPTLAADMMQGSQMAHAETGRGRSRLGGTGASRTGRTAPGMPQPSPMASMLLDPHHQPAGTMAGGRSVQRLRHPHRGLQPEPQTIAELLEEGTQSRRLAREDREEAEQQAEEVEEGAGMLGESTWETSPGKGLSRENSAANPEEPEAGVLGLIYQLRQTQHTRRGGGVI